MDTTIKYNKRRDIQISRLSYIKYYLDTNSNNNKKYKELYDLIKSLTFDKNGYTLSSDDLYNKVQDIMIENDGVIPNFPNKETIENIDDKVSAFKTLHPDEFEKYKNKVETELGKKMNKSKEQDDVFVSDEESEQDNKDLSINDRFKTLEELNPGFLLILGITKETKKESSKADDQKTDKDDSTTKDDKNNDKDQNIKESITLTNYLKQKILFE